VAEAGLVIAGKTRDMFTGRSGALYLLGEERITLASFATWGDVTPEVHVFDRGDCWALRRGKAHVVDDSSTGLCCPHVLAIAEPRGNPEAYVCIPLQAQAELLGVMHIHSVIEPGVAKRPALDDEETQIATGLAEHISLAIANLRLRDTLKEQAVHDKLTGLYNRRYLDLALKREISRSQREGSSFGIIMIDIDNFKRFNDERGHDVGDRLLHEVGLFLEGQVRGHDMACRYGGEEFTILMPGASMDVVRKRAEQLRAGAASIEIRLESGSIVSTTISAGVSVYPVNGSTAEEVLKAADSALYNAKRSGRNAVMAAEG
jgi:diguanylate cyclase (GGDEF)-like protein